MAAATRGGCERNANGGTGSGERLAAAQRDGRRPQAARGRRRPDGARPAAGPRPTPGPDAAGGDAAGAGSGSPVGRDRPAGRRGDAGYACHPEPGAPPGGGGLPLGGGGYAAHRSRAGPRAAGRAPRGAALRLVPVLPLGSAPGEAVAGAGAAGGPDARGLLSFQHAELRHPERRQLRRPRGGAPRRIPAAGARSRRAHRLPGVHGAGVRDRHARRPGGGAPVLLVTFDLLTAGAVNGALAAAPGGVSTAMVPMLGTPPAVLERMYAVRRRYDAVAVGTGTVLIDDPTLTSHVAAGERAVRVTLDRSGRIPRHARIFDGSPRTLVGVVASTPPAYLDFLA